jgi:hypothetical protein
MLEPRIECKKSGESMETGKKKPMAHAMGYKN